MTTLRLSDVEPVTIEAFRALGGRAHRQTIYRKVPTIGNFTPEQRELPPPPRNQGGFSDRLTFLVSFSISKLGEKGVLRPLGGGEWELIDSQQKIQRT